VLEKQPTPQLRVIKKWELRTSQAPPWFAIQFEEEARALQFRKCEPEIVASWTSVEIEIAPPHAVDVM
jgi:hypothetical protein